MSSFENIGQTQEPQSSSGYDLYGDCPVEQGLEAAKVCLDSADPKDFDNLAAAQAVVTWRLCSLRGVRSGCPGPQMADGVLHCPKKNAYETAYFAVTSPYSQSNYGRKLPAAPDNSEQLPDKDKPSGNYL